MSNFVKLKQVQAVTQGSIIIAGVNGQLTEDNSNLFWDNTNNRLGIGTATPATSLDVNGVTTLRGLVKNAAGTTMIDLNSGYSISDNAGNPIIYLGSKQLYTSGGLESLNWSSRSTKNASGFTTFTWEGCTLYDAAGVTSLEWSTRKIFGNDGTTRVANWNNGNFGINTDSATSKLFVIGTGSTSATHSLSVENSSGGNLLNVRDDGRIVAGYPDSGLGSTWGHTFASPTTGGTDFAFHVGTSGLSQGLFNIYNNGSFELGHNASPVVNLTFDGTSFNFAGGNVGIGVATAATSLQIGPSNGTGTLQINGGGGLGSTFSIQGHQTVGYILDIYNKDYTRFFARASQDGTGIGTNAGISLMYGRLGHTAMTLWDINGEPRIGIGKAHYSGDAALISSRQDIQSTGTDALFSWSDGVSSITIDSQKNLGYSNPFILLSAWSAGPTTYLGDVRIASYGVSYFKGGNVGMGVSNPSATLDIVGTLQYVDGNEGTGKVLTSDASGNATWEAPAAAVVSVDEVTITTNTAGELTLVNTPISKSANTFTPGTAGVPNTLTHNLGTSDIMVQLWDVVTGAVISADISNATTTQVDITFTSNPSGNVKAIIIG